MAATGSIYGSYRGFVAVTGSMWLLQGLYSYYRVYMAVTGSV